MRENSRVGRKPQTNKQIKILKGKKSAFSLTDINVYFCYECVKWFNWFFRLSNTIAQYSTNFGIFFASEYVKLIH